MFPHSDTVYTVHTLRLQDELQYAARQRLAATARDAAGIPPLHVAASESFGRIAKWFGARVHGAFAARRAQDSPDTASASPRIAPMNRELDLSTPVL